MRLFYFLLLIPTISISAPPDCDDSDLLAGTATCTSLTINQNLNLPGSGLAVPLSISVNGNVYIKANIILDGANGGLLTLATQSGVNGGPGGQPGGGIGGTFAEPGQTIPEGGFPGPLDADCGNGGGGGSSQVNDGDPGGFCDTGTQNGVPGTSPQNFPSTLSGGFGGGAGGEKSTAGVYDLGGGGGGGGAIRIEATGTITIDDGVVISAKGGNGGNSVNIGGAGGGGGGGTIHLIAGVAITNQGIFDVSGGQGGKARLVAPHGGNGGNGGNGIIRFEVGSNPPEDFTGRQDFSTGIPTSNRSSLKSDISCGTLAKKNNDQMLFQMALGFMMIVLLRTLSRIRLKA